MNLLDRVQVEIVQGNLENESTDVIVNLNDSQLKNEGIQAQKLVQKAGPNFKLGSNHLMQERH